MRVSYLIAAAATAAAISTAADAAYVEDATFGLQGTYAYNGSTANVDFAGSFAGALLGDPSVRRDYILTVDASLNGATLIDEALPIADIVGFDFSLEEAAFGIASILDAQFGLGTVFAFLGGITSNVSLSGNAISGNFAVSAPAADVLGFFDGFCGLFVSCPSVGATGEFDLALGLGYNDIAPVPLPAALPLLAAGFGGLVFAGRRRARA